MKNKNFIIIGILAILAIIVAVAVMKFIEVPKEVSIEIPVQIPGEIRIVAAGGSHTLTIKTDGTLWAWGDNLFGQLGLGEDIEYSNVPIQVGNDTDWKAVTAGGDHTLAIKTDGTLWAWGDNLLGKLGLGNQIDRLTPTQVGTDTDWKTVTAGEHHTLAIKTGGNLWAWGANEIGQLGLGDIIDHNIPFKVSF